MKWNVKNVNPMGPRPTFENKQEELEWLNAMIEVCCSYPDQGMQLLGASLIHQRTELKKSCAQ